MRWLAVLAAVAAASMLTLEAPAGEPLPVPPGNSAESSAVIKVPPTQAGAFDGTWIYVNRDARFVLWIRTKNGAPQVKLQYQSLATPEAFETDWDGKALYYLASNPVTFELKLGESNANQIVGKWKWDLEIGQSSRREAGDVVMYRTAYGRTIQMDFQNFVRTIVSHGKTQAMKAPMVWSWSKVSKRELLWDELPF